ncbi:transposase, partial [Amphritea sp. RP18W]|nr:transposase [Amphritea pacifica]
MTRARHQIISTADTPYYHCIARCVRRAFLCGEDSLTGQSYEHRRQWVIDRLKTLQAVFCIELC